MDRNPQEEVIGQLPAVVEMSDVGSGSSRVTLDDGQYSMPCSSRIATIADEVRFEIGIGIGSGLTRWMVDDSRSPRAER